MTIVLLVAGGALLLVAINAPRRATSGATSREVATQSATSRDEDATTVLEPVAAAVSSTTVAPPAAPDHDSTGPTYPSTPPTGVDAGYAASIAEMARSDLEPALFRETTAIGVAVLTADVTGKGRERWPGYWPPGPYRPCCEALRIHAAGARSDGPDQVLVRVLWSADRIGSTQAVRYRESLVPLSRRAGAWEPG